MGAVFDSTTPPGGTDKRASAVDAERVVGVSVGSYLCYLRVGTIRYAWTRRHDVREPEDIDMEIFAHFPNLTGLTVYSRQMTDAGLVRVARLTTLSDLTLVSPRVTDKGLATLQTMRGLRRLHLLGTAVTAEAVAASACGAPGVDCQCREL